ncbi:conserved hypothetical protein [Talaromyces stipitatus ATCC 10500]|uniref:Protein kinase domain-containing protein n=1 Tax=Talaromyces stipitatus (strain ATCC 10500 / CBS 375.48 / QM 6759 / NRRL 1006) TaxID=441959 RepID=B8M002_TALSN|nr:uncharacterized protein TSTA_081670 [Talaromyces stipitatus ATCC 10500]EED20934.1 conserved hypothetical protein [Talaromyces stipitatus ATCC 10500]
MGSSHRRNLLQEMPNALQKHVEYSQGINLQTHPVSSVRITNKSPWDTYAKVFNCELAGDVVIVVHRTEPSEVYALRPYREAIGAKVLHRLTQLQHKNILSAKECFCTEESMYALCQDFPLTLEDIITCDAYLDEIQLSAILTQVSLPATHLRVVD